MIWATTHLLDHMEVSHIEHHPDITDHASVKATIDLEMQREGPGLFRCKLGFQNNEHYQNLIKNVVKNEIYMALTPSHKNVLRSAFLKT